MNLDLVKLFLNYMIYHILYIIYNI
jgi:hypothetical protein